MSLYTLNINIEVEAVQIVLTSDKKLTFSDCPQWLVNGFVDGTLAPDKGFPCIECKCNGVRSLAKVGDFVCKFEDTIFILDESKYNKQHL